MDNYETMKPWEHGKIVEIHHDIKSISVYPVVYENKDFYVCRLSGSTEIITIEKILIKIMSLNLTKSI